MKRNTSTDKEAWNQCAWTGCEKPSKNRTGKHCGYHINKLYRLNNPEFFKVSARLYYLENQSYILARNRLTYRIQWEKRAAYNKKYLEENRERKKEYLRAYRAKKKAEKD